MNNKFKLLTILMFATPYTMIHASSSINSEKKEIITNSIQQLKKAQQIMSNVLETEELINSNFIDSNSCYFICFQKRRDKYVYNLLDKQQATAESLTRQASEAVKAIEKIER